MPLSNEGQITNRHLEQCGIQVPGAEAEHSGTHKYSADKQNYTPTSPFKHAVMQKCGGGAWEKSFTTVWPCIRVCTSHLTSKNFASLHLLGYAVINIGILIAMAIYSLHQIRIIPVDRFHSSTRKNTRIVTLKMILLQR